MINESIYLIYLITGFTVGISHCIGMCGPIVVAISMGREKDTVLLPLTLYHAGRITTYMMMGGVMGFVGSFTQVAEYLLSIQYVVLIATGILIILMGLAMMGILPVIRFFDGEYTGSRFIANRLKQLIRSKRTVSYLPMGLLLGFLPCGPVYVALTAATGSGVTSQHPMAGALSGMGIMACFGIGTVPALFVLGKVSALKMLSPRIWIYRIAGGFVVLSGGYFFMERLFLG